MTIRTSLVALLALAGCAWTTGPTPADRMIPDADLRVLFVGNSLTYTNDLPGVVEEIARAAGRSFAQGSVTLPAFSLEDHWYYGIADVIAAEAADVVVLQQGPSSLPSNQIHLRTWAAQLTGPIREAGGEPALLMVWPESTRVEAFDAVRDAYAGAAEAVNGLFIPAGESWRAAWALDPALQLYGGDGFHPAPLGTYAAALATYAVLYGTAPDDLDCAPPPSLALEAAAAATACAGVRDALAAMARAP